MNKVILLLFLSLASTFTFAQTTYSSSPSAGTWAGCPSSTINGSCNFTYIGSSTIQLKVNSISGNQITFTVGKCGGSAFSAGTTFYLREQAGLSTAITDLVCGNNFPTNGISVGGATTGSYTYSASFTSGTKSFVGVTIASNGNRYYTNPIVITATTNCSTPSGLGAGTISTSGFNSSWNAVNGALGYEVEVMECGGFNSTIHTTTITSKYISGLNCGGCYWYRVRANCGGTYSAWTASNTVNLNTCAVPSSASVTFSNITASSFTASWPSVANATNYAINIAACGASTYTNTPVNTSGNTSYTFSGLAANSGFKVQLQSICGGNCTSTWSSSSNCVNTLNPNSYTINITTPNSGSFTTGQNMSIIWNYTGLLASDYIQFELYNTNNTTTPQVVLYQGTGTINSGSSNWTIANTVPTGTYYLKAYKVGCGSPCDFDLSGNFTITNNTPNPTLSLITPSLNTTWNCGTTQTISWSTTNLSSSANMAIELTNTLNTTVHVITSSTLNSGTYNWSISNPIPQGLPAGQYKIKVYQVGSGNPNNYSAIFNLTCNTLANCITWTPAAGPAIPAQIDQEAYDAMQYLCIKNIIQTSQLVTDINNPLLREELAKIVFKALYSPNGPSNPYTAVNAPSDDFPVPYFDLQAPYTSYTKEAKALCYLEYGDCVSPFDRDFTHFRPMDSIWKKHALKVMLEAFNIAPAPSNTPVPWPAGVYTDISPNTGEYGYIVKAYQLGIIGQSSPTFGNTEKISRRNAFRYLYKLLQLYDSQSPLIGGGNKPAPTTYDYFHPFNQKVGNLNSLLGIDQGAFNSYTKTSFGVAGKMPLVFAHSYNSAQTTYPQAFNVFQPLGKGWNHNYNCYIKRFDNGYGGDRKFVIFWGDGTMISYDSSGANAFTPLEEGVYSSLQLVNAGTRFLYTTKSKVVYQFDLNNGISGNKVWCLTSIKDRNNNALTISWQVNNNIGLVQQVQDAYNRKLMFTYNASNLLTSVSCMTGAITRSILFNVNATTKDLASYSDPMGNVTTYIYDANPTPCTEHLLKQIQLPKGNIIDNTYDKRKLASMAFAGQYSATVLPIDNFVSGNNTNYTQTTIQTTQQGSTITNIIQHDELGNVRSISDPTSSLNIDYHPTQKTKPTSFTNTINGISATTTYDANGNVLNVTKNAASMPTITESFTYNSYNDVLTYTNANSNTTTFTYNGTGNLTNITDALSNATTIIPNADGTVQKVTNPSGFYTEYMYDSYGNTIQSKLMNSIISSALYDDASRLTEATNPNSVKTKYNYNQNDQVTQVIYDFGNLNNTMSYTYDQNGNLTTVTNPKGDNTILTYNNQDQLVQYNFLGLLKKYRYNENGTLDTFINQNGNAFKHTYNTDGMLVNDGYASYGYYALTKNLQTITQNSKVITFGYDNYQRVNSIAYNDFPNNTVQYQYDNTNNITRITYPGGFTVSYTYDALGRLYQVKNFATNFIYATYSYHSDGRLQQCVNGNGTKTLYIYDNFGRLDSISNQTSNNAIICAYGFTLDNVGNHTSENCNEPFAPTFPSIVNNTTSYTHTNTNRMTAIGNTTTTFNNNGNELTNTGALNATYTWDTKENLLTSTSPNLNCEYDGAENRRKRNNTRFVLDLLGDNILMETDLNGNPSAYYIQGLGLICRLDASQANPAYYHYDYRGSTTAITNANQVVTHKYLYGAFGEQLAVAETGFSNPFRYVGKYGVMYEDSSLYFMRARYYNPNKGRFLGEDPIWSSNNYTYSYNDGVNFADPSGKISFKSFLKVGFFIKGFADITYNNYKNGNTFGTGYAEFAIKNAGKLIGGSLGSATGCDVCGTLVEAITEELGKSIEAGFNEADRLISFSGDPTISEYLVHAYNESSKRIISSDFVVSVCTNFLSSVAVDYIADTESFKKSIKTLLGGIDLRTTGGQAAKAAAKKIIDKVGGDSTEELTNWLNNLK